MNFTSIKLKRAALCLILLVIIALLALWGINAFNTWRFDKLSEMPAAAVVGDRKQHIEHGAYLAKLGDCVACHTARGGHQFAGGLPLDTGFGLVVSSNITPDMDTGIGGWSREQFIQAMRHGVGKHGKQLYPAMPYNAYAKVSNADMADLKMYLDTLPPVRHAVEENQMRFPFNIRPLMMGWNLLFLDPAPFQDDPSKSQQLNRGAYLVLGLGHCSACHTAKNPLGGDTSQFLQGAVLQKWYAPGIAGEAWHGVANWSAADIATYLKTGVNKHAIAVGPMAEAVENSTQYFNDADLDAVAAYLKSFPVKTNVANGPSKLPIPSDRETMLQGRRIYASVCASCHGVEGEGQPGMGPALRGNLVVAKGPDNNVLHLILAGGYSAKTQTHPQGFAMPAFGWKLDDTEVAALATYIRNDWGNTGSAVSEAAVAAMRAHHAESPPK